jgi:hypothetical protein
VFQRRNTWKASFLRVPLGAALRASLAIVALAFARYMSIAPPPAPSLGPTCMLRHHVFFGMDSNHRKVKKHSTSSSHDLVHLVNIYIGCSVYVSIFIIINSNIVIKTKSKIEY